MRNGEDTTYSNETGWEIDQAEKSDLPEPLGILSRLPRFYSREFRQLIRHGTRCLYGGERLGVEDASKLVVRQIF